VKVATEGSPRSAAVGWQQANISAIGDALGWRPAIDLDTSMRDLWQALPCAA
jgi:hypothetical protein